MSDIHSVGRLVENMHCWSKTVPIYPCCNTFCIYSNRTALACLIWAGPYQLSQRRKEGGLFRLARFRPPAASPLTPDTIFTGDFHEKRTQLAPGYYGRYGALGGFYIWRLDWCYLSRKIHLYKIRRMNFFRWKEGRGSKNPKKVWWTYYVEVPMLPSFRFHHRLRIDDDRRRYD